MFSKKHTHGKHSENQARATLLLETFTFIRKLSICKGVSLTVPERGGSLETLISGEGTDLNLHNNLTLVYCAFPGNFPRRSTHPQHPLLPLAENGI